MSKHSPTVLRLDIALNEGEKVAVRLQGPFPAHDHPRAGRVGGLVDQLGELGDLSVAQLAVTADGR